jgi:hypothetical protein
MIGVSCPEGGPAADQNMREIHGKLLTSALTSFCTESEGETFSCAEAPSIHEFGDAREK